MQISGDAIQVYEADGTTVVNAIDFGISHRDFFGNIPKPTHKVVVKNLSATQVRVVITGDGGDGIVPVFGPTTGDLKPYPDNAFQLQPRGQSGDMAMGYVGLTLSQPSTGSKMTTIIFRATETGVSPAGPLRVAVECDTGSSSCANSSESAFKIEEVIEIGGLGSADVVDGLDIDTAAELSNYDVVVIGGNGEGPVGDYAEFQTALRQWVLNGGGVVDAGWTIFHLSSLGLQGGDLDLILPMDPSTTTTTQGLITITGGTNHPVTAGVSNFTSPSFNVSGPLKAGTTVLAVEAGGNPAVVVWEVGAGRVVSFSPGYYATYANYTNEPLLDGSITDALNLFLQAVQWAGRRTGTPGSPNQPSSQVGFAPPGSSVGGE